MSGAVVDAPLFARRLLPLAIAAFQRVPVPDRAPVMAALDGFLAVPSPATFLAAARTMEQGLRDLLIADAARGPLRRGFTAAIQALRDGGALPAPLIDELAAHLPVDARAIERLDALAALAGAHAALSVRVAADADQRRRRWKLPPRPRARPLSPPRNRGR